MALGLNRSGYDLGVRFALKRRSPACFLLAALFAAWHPALGLASQPGQQNGRPGPSDTPPQRAAGPADYRSTHFLLHTDLASAKAHRLLRRLETMLSLISKYWGQQSSGVIECYVVDDLEVWPADALDPAGRAKIARRSGITHIETVNRGRQLVGAKAVVYAVADRGTAQHEAVHAYCGQTFGRIGPLWYSEGMAEMGTYWRRGDNSVRCPDYVIDYLRGGRPKPIRQIVGENGNSRRGAPVGTGDSWRNYAWRWALCHLLANNTNYSDRFRPLGLGYLNGAPVSFARTYGAMMDEIDFEYRFFLEHVDQGYRVDLCSWDWKHKFRQPRGGSIRSRVAANRGWQPSGVIVRSGQEYDYTTSGVWQVGPDRAELTADGLANGRGRLQGVVFSDYDLSAPFGLSAAGTFTSPADGKLFLRCRDAWNELADNSGLLRVNVRKSGQTESKPAPRDAREIEAPGPANAR